ncbi:MULTISPECIES: SDR family oxidoreductase [Zymobacter]|uniref:Nucleoside-diphosphate-sugar epimerases n=1 Tax=Zymobacter palmae TaxID=33074 RepID=A0A348HIJ0_9GAMM|nr:SDR family oxidoreductase [Zymobacter palmae]BBG31442.1 nucleoside-diphosphate-sugar epimerases [Zymobacter palmae]
MNSTTLILGCGDIGSALGERLLAAGHRVIGARRHPERLPSGITPLAFDVTQPPEALPDADILVYAVSAERFEESAYKTAYPEGLDAVLTLAEQQKRPPRHVFFVSSTSVYDQNQGEEVDEESATEPKGFSGRLMLEAERRLLASPLPGTVVRLSGIYGHGRERLIRQVGEGRIAPQVPMLYSNRIHRDDAVNVLAWLIERVIENDTLDDCYLASDLEPAPLHDVMTWLAQELKVEPHDYIQSPLRRRSSKRCSSARLVRQGYRFLYPTYRDGYRQILKARG